MTDRSHCELAEATRRDAGAVRDLLARCGLPVDDVDACLPGFVLARRDGTLVGVAGLERAGNYGLLRSVAVEPAERNRGIGAQLCRRVMDRARRDGIVVLFLLTTDAAQYFERLGFSAIERVSTPPEIARTTEFTVSCPASATVMRRAL